jgi:hypothetical protein
VAAGRLIPDTHPNLPAGHDATISRNGQHFPNARSRLRQARRRITQS